MNKRWYCRETESERETEGGGVTERPAVRDGASYAAASLEEGKRRRF